MMSSNRTPRKAAHTSGVSARGMEIMGERVGLALVELDRDR
jgi:hypothetical protein